MHWPNPINVSMTLLLFHIFHFCFWPKKQNMYEGLCVRKCQYFVGFFFLGGAHYGIPSDDHISRNFVRHAKTKKKNGGTENLGKTNNNKYSH